MKNSKLVNKLKKTLRDLDAIEARMRIEYPNLRQRRTYPKFKQPIDKEIKKQIKHIKTMIQTPLESAEEYSEKLRSVLREHYQEMPKSFKSEVLEELINKPKNTAMIENPTNTESVSLKMLKQLKEDAEATAKTLRVVIDDLENMKEVKEYSYKAKRVEPELTRDTGKPNIYGCSVSITPTGEIFTKQFKKEFESDFDAYNSYLSPSYAEVEADYTLASRRVRAFAKAVNGDWKADWEDREQRKWGIGFCVGDLSVQVRNNSNDYIHQIAFKSEELAQKALELFKPEWEILANP
jgi:hypothetical protein